MVTKLGSAWQKNNSGEMGIESVGCTQLTESLFVLKVSIWKSDFFLNWPRMLTSRTFPLFHTLSFISFYLFFLFHLTLFPQSLYFFYLTLFFFFLFLPFSHLFSVFFTTFLYSFINFPPFFYLSFFLPLFVCFPSYLAFLAFFFPLLVSKS